MNKILAYAVRPDETKLFKQWGDHFGLEIDLHSHNLSAENASLAKGYESIVFLAEDLVTRPVLEELKRHGITYITSRSVGVDNVDFPVAQELGIAVANVPGYSPNSVSEFALLSTLSLLRNYPLYLKRVQQQDFRIMGLVGREIRNQVVAVIGTGRIGCETLKNFSGFHPKELLAFDTHKNPAAESLARYAAMDEIYEKADVIVYHVPLNEATKHIICKKNIDKMKDHVILINVSRGGIMNAQDVVDGIQAGKIGGIAVDVYENELPYYRFNWQEKFIDDPILRDLLMMPQAVVTPHAAFYTDEAVSNMVSVALGNLREFADTGTCSNIIKR